MSDIHYRVLDTFPEPAFAALCSHTFADYEESRLLAEVLTEEAAAGGKLAPSALGALRIAAFEGDQLVGWTYARAEGAQLHMVQSGVAPAARRRGVYTRLTQMVIDYARLHGHVGVQSRHTARNSAVIIAKLRLGFLVSGFEYSEVYGPLVRLTYLPGDLRRALYLSRSAPIRRAADAAKAPDAP